MKIHLQITFGGKKRMHYMWKKNDTTIKTNVFHVNDKKKKCEQIKNHYMKEIT